MICRHCSTRKVTRPRGLCWTCYYTPGIKRLYFSTSKKSPNCAKPNEGEPTMEELDAMVAERSRPENLPAWWHKCSGMREDD